MYRFLRYKSIKYFITVTSLVVDVLHFYLPYVYFFLVTPPPRLPSHNYPFPPSQLSYNGFCPFIIIYFLELTTLFSCLDDFSHIFPFFFLVNAFKLNYYSKHLTFVFVFILYVISIFREKKAMYIRYRI